MAANTSVLISRMGDTAVCVTMVTCWHQTEDTVKVIRISKERTAYKVLNLKIGHREVTFETGSVLCEIALWNITGE